MFLEDSVKIVINDDELTTAFVTLKYHPDNNILIDHFSSTKEQKRTPFSMKKCPDYGDYGAYLPAGIHSGIPMQSFPFTLGEFALSNGKVYGRDC